uniref:Putative defensin 2 n=1 Tax=Ixodes ricinus TaxID=34613 RepID=V5IBJ2_IXORI
MKVVGIALVVVLIAGLISFSCTQRDDSQLPHVKVRHVFGCPSDHGTCHSHCRSIGRRGGHCSGFGKRTCTCYQK